MATEDDQAGTVFNPFGPRQSRLQGVEVFGRLAQFHHVPSVAGEAARSVVGQRHLGDSIDGDVVVVVDHDQPTQAQVPGQ